MSACKCSHHSRRFLLLLCCILFCLSTSGCGKSGSGSSAAGNQTAPAANSGSLNNTPAAENLTAGTGNLTGNAAENSTAGNASAGSNTQLDFNQASSDFILPEDAAKDAAFETLFAKNPLDAAEKACQNDALTTAAMEGLASDYANAWKNETIHAYEELQKKTNGSEKEAFAMQYQNWMKNEAAALEEAKSKYTPTGGTIDRIEYAAIAFDFYQDAAKQAYRVLYRYDENYSYLFDTGYLTCLAAPKKESAEVLEAKADYRLYSDSCGEAGSRTFSAGLLCEYAWDEEFLNGLTAGMTLPVGTYTWADVSDLNWKTEGNAKVLPLSDSGYALSLEDGLGTVVDSKTGEKPGWAEQIFTLTAAKNVVLQKADGTKASGFAKLSDYLAENGDTDAAVTITDGKAVRIVCR